MTTNDNANPTAERALASARAFINGRAEFAVISAELTGEERPRLRFVSTVDPGEVREVAPSAWLELEDTPRTFILRTLTGQALKRSKYA